MSLAIELPAAIAISEEVVFALTEVAVADWEPGAVGESEEQAASPRIRPETAVRFRNDSGLMLHFMLPPRRIQGMHRRFRRCVLCLQDTLRREDPDKLRLGALEASNHLL
jgi:hypothetical protein